MKTRKKFVIISIFISLLASLLNPFANSAKAQSSTTFPVDEAGIAAYVKLDNIENFSVDKIGDALSAIESSGESYIIGTANVSGASIFPHVYIGLDGWAVAYYLKNEEASRIIQWNNYVAGNISTNILKDALDSVAGKIGTNYSTPVKYYDFEFPEANRLALVAEMESNNFYITVPGILYEASYEVMTGNICGGEGAPTTISLKIDEHTAFSATGGGGYTYWKPVPNYFFGYYNLSDFETGITHHIVFKGCGTGTRYATVLVYKTNQ